MTAACLSRDNHLLLAVGTRIQEVRLVQEENAGYRRGAEWKILDSVGMVEFELII